MKLTELQEQLENKKTEVRAFLDDKKADEAETAMQEKRNIEKLIKMEEALEVEEKRQLENQKNEKGDDKMGQVNEMRAITSLIMEKEVTTEERAAIKTTDNSAVLPKQFVNQIVELQKGYGSLKQLCDVIPVFKNEGTIPVIDLDQNEMLDVLEGADIVDGTLVTTEIPFSVSKVGLIQTLTSELVDDAEVEIESLAKKNFVNIATAKENGKILDIIKTNAVAVTGATEYDAIATAIDTSLPSVKSGLITLTNVTSYAYLKNKKDAQKRPLNLITELNGVEYFHGKPIYTVEDSLLPVTEGSTYIFYVGNTKEAVKYCDRNAVTVARSTEAGFRDDTVKIRILERFGVVKGSVRSLKRIEF